MTNYSKNFENCDISIEHLSELPTSELEKINFSDDRVQEQLKYNSAELYEYCILDTIGFQQKIYFYFNEAKEKSFELVTYSRNNKLIDYHSLTTIGGDGGYSSIQSSNYKDDVFISTFEESYRTLTCPYDTIMIYKKGKTKIYIDKETGKIEEDTISVEKNLTKVIKNEDCE